MSLQLQKALNRIVAKKLKKQEKGQDHELMSLNEFAKVNYSFEDSYIKEPR